MASTYKSTTTKTIAIARANFITSREWRSEETTWDAFVQSLSNPHQHDQGTREHTATLGQENGRNYLKRRTPAFFGGRLVDGSKTAKGVVCRDLLVIDVDSGQHTLDDLLARLAGYEAVVYPTISHLATETNIAPDDYVKFAGPEFAWTGTGDDGRKTGIVRTDIMARLLMEKKGYPRAAVAHLLDNIGTFELGYLLGFETGLCAVHEPIERYRIVMPLATQFVADNHDRPAVVWKHANLAVFDRLGIKVDRTCAELNRGFYVPAITWDEQVPTVEHIRGEPLDLDTIIADLPKEKPRQSADSGSKKGLPQDYKDVLAAIDPGPRETWLKVGMAIHHAADGSDEGYDIWREWAAQASSNHEADDRKTWRNFKTDRESGITWGSVEKLAREAGWKRCEASLAWPEVRGKAKEPEAKSILNIEAALKHLGIAPYYDEFADRHHIDGQGVLDDIQLRKLWAEVHLLGLKVDFNFFFRVVVTIAERDKRHPVRAYLDGVQPTWDGTMRLDTWLMDYAQAEDTSFNRAVGALWMMAAARRVREPGCKFDTMLVLESVEGMGKSTLGAILGRTWFSDCLPMGPDPKVVIEQTRGFWIVEFAELKDIKRTEVENVRSFLSRRVDSARAAYGQTRNDVARQFVTYGSTNDTTYLMSNNGSRRFWPVAVGKIDIDGVRRDLDQLWAEAAVREARGESIALPEELWGEAAKIQESRRVKHPMEEFLAEALGGREGIVRLEHLYAALGLSGGNVSKRSAQHGPLIKTTMERLGWKHARKRVGGDKNKSTVFQRGDGGYLHKWDAAANQFLIEGLASIVPDPIEEFAGEPMAESTVVAFRRPVSANQN